MREDREETDSDARAREAFSLLADETRLDIVAHLRDAGEPQSYAEIKNAIGVRDSGRFNYHLNELLGTFVTESEAGYVLSFGATALYQAILSTRPLSEHPSLEVTTDESCPECGSALSVCYLHELVVSQCPDCDTQSFAYPFPAGGFAGRTDEAVLEAAVQRMYHHISLALRGVCPYCSGRMAATWTDDADTPLHPEVLARHACALCGMELETGPVAMAQQHAAVIALFDDYGLRPREMLPREFREYVPPGAVTVEDTEPFVVTVPAEIRGDDYRLRVEEREDGVDVAVEL